MSVSITFSEIDERERQALLNFHTLVNPGYSYAGFLIFKGTLVN